MEDSRPLVDLRRFLRRRLRAIAVAENINFDRTSVFVNSLVDAVTQTRSLQNHHLD